MTPLQTIKQAKTKNELYELLEVRKYWTAWQKISITDRTEILKPLEWKKVVKNEN